MGFLVLGTVQAVRGQILVAAVDVDVLLDDLPGCGLEVQIPVQAREYALDDYCALGLRIVLPIDRFELLNLIGIRIEDDILVTEVDKLINNDINLHRMKENLKKMKVSDSASIIYDKLKELIK